ncbi:MAG: multidrug transporter AcrB [Candidatus Hydrogenedentota bacterium]
MRTIIAAFARNRVFANIVLVTIIFSGLLASVLMVREAFPEFSVDIITINVLYPGADPEEVEEAISRKIEEAIEGLEGIKQYDTVSMENVGLTYIEVKESYDVEWVKDEVRTRVEAISTFPVDAEKPIIVEVTLKREVVALALSGPLNERQLKEWGENIKDELLNLPDISQVSVAGTRDYEITIEISEEKLRQYGLTFDQVSNIIRANSLNLAGGTIRTKGEEIRLRTLGRNYTGADFSKIIILSRPNGETITLDKLAKINDGFTEDRLSGTMNGEPCVLVMVSKTQEEDAIAIAAAVRQWVAEKQGTLPEGLDISIWDDQSVMIQQRIDLLLRNGLMGLALVFILLWVFLDLRLSIWASMGIPISLLGGLAIMWFLGATINMISLFGLIMVLGIIVDDAIVVGEAIYVHRKKGDGPLAAAVNGTMEVGMPVVAAVTTTMVAFVPLMFVGGVMGKFIAILPIAVIAALFISLVESIIMFPAHLNNLPDPNRPPHHENPVIHRLRAMRLNISNGLEWFVEHMYAPFLRLCLRWRYVVFSMAVAVFLLTLGLNAGGFLRFILFPDIDGDQITASVEFPNGTPYEVTEAAVRDVEAALSRIQDKVRAKDGSPVVLSSYSLVGSGMATAEFDNRTSSGQHLGAVRAKLVQSEFRDLHSKDLMVLWEKEVGVIPGITALTFAGMETGPPGAAIEIWVQGRDMEQILGAADRLKQKLQSYEGVLQVQTDFRPGKNEFRMRLKPEARSLGITVNDLASQVYAGYFGEEALRIQRGRDDIRVKVRYTAEERSQVDDLANVRIRTPMGTEVPLMSVADISYGPGYASIIRTDGFRRVSVSADVDTSVTTATIITNALTKGTNGQPGAFGEVMSEFPGVRMEFQGEAKESADSLGSLYVGFPLALAGIFVIIATIFRSYLQPFIIMLTVPFGIIGALWGHFLLGYPLTIMSMFGIVALAGVVVNDAIVFIECVNTNISEGTSFFRSIVNAGTRRFRAIFLTTVTTVGGLAPMIMEKDVQAQFLVPMALSLAAGVGFATLLTLLLVPCLLGILNDIRRGLRYLFSGVWVAPEEVEPARQRIMNPEEELEIFGRPEPPKVNLSFD